MTIPIFCYNSNVKLTLNKTGMRKFKKIKYWRIFLYMISGPITIGHAQPWSILGGFGYTWYESAYHGNFNNTFNTQTAIGDGQTAFGRFAIARQLFFNKNLYFGIESGIQSGNTFRLNISQHQIMDLGGILPQATIKPMLDFLTTMYYQFQKKPTFGVLKLGIAWRRMQINDRVTFNDLSQPSFDVQLGLGINISSKAALSLNYQSIFNKKTTYTLNNNKSIGYVSNIPIQNGLLLNVSYQL